MGISVIQRLRQQGYEVLHISIRDGTVNDLSPYKNHGTMIGGVSIQKSENGMSCWSNGSNGIVSVGTGASVLPNMFSLCFWAKETIPNNQIIVGWDNSGAAVHPCFSPSWDSGRPLIFLNPNNFRYFTAPTFDGRWHFWVVIVTGNAMADINNSVCYYDANPLTINATAATVLPTAKAYLRIGNTAGSAYPFKGYYDTVILYNGYNLNAWEVATLMAETKPRD